MSVDTYHQLKEANDPTSHQYLSNNFNSLFNEATGLFANYGWGAIVLALLVAVFAWGSWWLLRKKIAWGWLWLIPVIGFTIYASIKALVIAQLIIRAPELPQMWELYFRYWMPLKMLRTSVSGLLITTLGMWGLLWWQRRKS